MAEDVYLLSWNHAAFRYLISNIELRSARRSAQSRMCNDSTMVQSRKRFPGDDSIGKANTPTFRDTAVVYYLAIASAKEEWKKCICKGSEHYSNNENRFYKGKTAILLCLCLLSNFFEANHKRKRWLEMQVEKRFVLSICNLNTGEQTRLLCYLQFVKN